MTKGIDTEEIEAQYRQSPFVKEICVSGGLYAVVVPDTDLMRARRVVNIGDLLRFEIEGQSIHLPPHKRLVGHEVSFQALPRTATGALDREEIERRIRQKRELVQSAQWQDAHASDVAAVVASRTTRVVTPDANLEIDLALDSLERVLLIAALEQRFGVEIPEEQTHRILTVADLIDALHPEVAAGNPQAGDVSWATLLRDLPVRSDPVLGRLLRRRSLTAGGLFVALRALRAIMPRLKITGVEHLPRDGSFIICPNHQSFLDPVFLSAALPFRIFKQLFIVGATEYFETPVTAWLARRVNLVAVDPDANLVPAMRTAAFGLKHGKVLVLFPEGERSIDGTVKRFKKGGAILARHMNVPIVPVAIHGLFELWPRNRAFNWRLLTPFTGHCIRIAFGAPMHVPSEATDVEAAEMLRERVVRMWARLGAARPEASPQVRSE